MKIRNKKQLYTIVLLVVIAAVGKFLLPADNPASLIDSKGKLLVSYIDVGQGDSAFLEFPGGKTALIDAGERDYGDEVADYLRQRGCRKIDYLICSHPHSDHIGGMQQVVEEFDVGQVYMPKVSHNSRLYENLLLAIQKKGLTIKTAKAGVTIEVESGVTMTMAAPVSDGYDELNDYSAVVRVAYGETSFLFTGDAEVPSEQEMLLSGQFIDADILKVGHHGSTTSSSEDFLKAVSPAYAVISCGTDNSYGHPHDEILELLDELEIPVYRTDLEGTIQVLSDGKNVEFLK